MRQLGRTAPTDGNAGVYLGNVTRVVGRTAYVEVPRLALGYEYPARYPAELAAGATTLPAGAHTHVAATSIEPAPDHVHQLRPLHAGDDVAVAFLEGGRDELIVLIRLA